ncbi:TetR/AcrR family transcriptional regulator C-terminal domain-containing protein [Amycolatopsis nigrescens]|uniref:TetR/AcrR family transcriptional regulator C-terminal domain-containing protein n=1 Tax=Amycolatopsis nigrescens TaxID=381445 RepID=UPI0004777000|nr:TetR/AcrR family transcriptional regulator C-terminal domain-containing protein [Amycolatopsis nigrescens]
MPSPRGHPRTSPRTSPAKAPLSRDAIVAAALALVDELGCDAVSMRRVSQALDTGPASLYVYVHDRRQLMALAHDLAVAGVELPTEADGDWRARLELLVNRAVAGLAAHDDIGSVGLTEVPTGPHFLRLTEELLRLLRAGGIGDAACALAADLLGQYIASSALEEAARTRAQRELQRSAGPEQTTAAALSEAASAHLDAVYRSLPAERYPTISALAPLLTGEPGGSRAEWKLRVIIDGVLAQAPA